MKSQLTRQAMVIPMDAPDPTGGMETIALFAPDGTPINFSGGTSIGPWHVVGATDEPPFSGFWQPYSYGTIGQPELQGAPPRFRRNGDRVELDGVVGNHTDGEIASGPIFYLPSEFWPPYSVEMGALWGRNLGDGSELEGLVRLQVIAQGIGRVNCNVMCETDQFVLLTGLSFPITPLPPDPPPAPNGNPA